MELGKPGKLSPKMLEQHPVNMLMVQEQVTTDRAHTKGVPY